MNRDRHHLWLVLSLPIALALATAGCSSGGAGASGAASPSSSAAADASASSGATSSGAATAEPSRTIPRVSLPAPTVDVASVPATLMTSIVSDASTRLSVDASAVTVTRAQAITWPSSALGCAQPGHLYTDALVPGYWVVVEANGTRVDYRATQDGTFTVCTNPPGPG